MLETYTIQLEVGETVEINYDGINPVSQWDKKHVRQLNNKIEVDISKGMKEDMLFFNNFESRLEWKVVSTAEDNELLNCEMCSDPMSEEDHDFSDICGECNQY
tara:strand:+ start:284 stop:592 length:309 start_codon:yes stop_codon:yes gene_type:complete